MNNWAGPEEQWPDDDRFTALFEACVAASAKVVDYPTSQYAAGLLAAYALVTGDTHQRAWELVKKAQEDRERLARARPELVPS